MVAIFYVRTMSDIMHTTSCGDCCNGPTSPRSNCFETKPREIFFDWCEKCKNRLKTGDSVLS